MKKILVVLLILSVAWGVFAQDGSWRVSGNVEIGTRLNFDPTPWNNNDSPKPEDDQATVAGIGYNHWDAPSGRFALIYGTFVNDGALSTGLKFNTRAAGAENEPFFSYNGENFNFSTALYGNALLVGGVGQDAGSLSDGDGYIKRLWGNYKFVNGIVFIEVAYRGEEQEFWYSDTTAGGRALNNALAGGKDRGTDLTRSAGFFGKPSTFTFTDSGGANYFLTQINLSALSFGIIVPELFGGRVNYYTGYGGGTPGPNVNGFHKHNTGYVVEGPDKRDKISSIYPGVFKETVFGVKFNMAPVEFAAQFKVQDAGAYIGAKFFTGPVTVGASFSGIFNPGKWPDGTTHDDYGDISGTYMAAKFFKVGGDVNFNGGVFQAGLAGSYERISAPDDSSQYGSLIRVQPRFSYNVIPSHLCFALDAGFYFLGVNGVTVTSDGSEKQSDITWAVQPQIFWTFLGTGARNGYGWTGPFYQGGPTGIIARYRIVSAGAEWRAGGAYAGQTPIQQGGWTAVNALDVVFQFNF
jgi:hypothetical protein